MNFKMTNYSTVIEEETGNVTSYGVSIQLRNDTVDGTNNVAAYVTITGDVETLENMTKRDILAEAVSRVKAMVQASE